MAVPDSTHPIWEKISGVLVINLDSSLERYQCIEKILCGRVPADKWHRLSAIAGRELPDYGKEPWFTESTLERAPYWGGVAGCVLSHKKAIETARDNGWDNVLILEDDVSIADVPAGAWDLAAEALESMGERYLFYLGCSRPVPYGRCVEKSPCGHSVWRVDGVLGAYAYIVPKALYEPILSMMEMKDGVWEWLSIYRAVDVFYRDFVSAIPGVGVYTISPVLIEQAASTSDIWDGEEAVYTDMEDTLPISYYSLRGLCHLLLLPLRRLKVRLNSVRTHRRALRGGLPGYRKHN